MPNEQVSLIVAWGFAGLLVLLLAYVLRKHELDRSQWRKDHAQQFAVMGEAYFGHFRALMEQSEKQADRLQARSLAEVRQFRAPETQPIANERPVYDEDWENPSMGYRRPTERSPYEEVTDGGV